MSSASLTQLACLTLALIWFGFSLWAKIPAQKRAYTINSSVFVAASLVIGGLS